MSFTVRVPSFHIPAMPPFAPMLAIVRRRGLSYTWPKPLAAYARD